MDGSWLPIVGAGFSRNAVTHGGYPPASWARLAKELGKDVEGSDENTGPLEVLSAFEHAFGRVALVDRTASLIRAHDAIPGAAHLAFARVGFTTVITTNFDSLLERAFQIAGHECLPVVEESQLSTRNRYPGPRLIKVHGDINRPATMVITEDDYDRFLHTHPLMATSVTATLVERTGILVGYSLDDPDTRQMLALVKQRLGSMYRPLWTIRVAAPEYLVQRFERRGVKVINLPNLPDLSIGEHFELFFDELAKYWRGRLPEVSVSTDDRVTADLQVPEEPSRICFFSIPAHLIGWYRDYIFPEVEALGMVPVTAWDVLTPPGARTAQLDVLIERAALVVAEFGEDASAAGTSLAIAQKPPGKVLLVASSQRPAPPFDASGALVLWRPSTLGVETDRFIEDFRAWISNTANPYLLDTGEAEKLLAGGHPTAALISAVSLLEVALSRWLVAHRDMDLAPSDSRDFPRFVPLRSMLELARRRGLFETETEVSSIQHAVNARNEAIHNSLVIPEQTAAQGVEAIRKFVGRLR